MNKNTLSRLVGFGILLSQLVPAQVFAAPEKNHYQSNQKIVGTHTYLKANLGLGFSDASPSHTDNIGQMNYVYTPKDEQQPIIYGLEFGIEQPFQNFLWQLGLSVQKFNTSDFKGQLAINIVEPSDTYDYQYKVSNTSLLITNRFAWELGSHWLPYLSFGIGYGSNQAKDYSVGSKNIQSDQDLTISFANKTLSHLVYQLGLGVDYAINSHFRIGLAYRLDALGEVKLGDGVVISDEDSKPATSPEQNQWLINSMQLNLSYIF